MSDGVAGWNEVKPEALQVRRICTCVGHLSSDTVPAERVFTSEILPHYLLIVQRPFLLLVNSSELRYHRERF